VKQTDHGIVRQQLKNNLSDRRARKQKRVAPVFTGLFNKTGNVRIKLALSRFPLRIVVVEK
jgi:hypothetical protein